MGFWIFMCIMDLLIPFTMIIFGNLFYKRAPKKINCSYGYRTTMSMKNKDTWCFAHHYCGKIWRYVGWLLLLFSIIAMPFSFGKGIPYVGKYGGIICSIQAAVLVTSVIPTEIALRRTFDKNGDHIK